MRTLAAAASQSIASQRYATLLLAILAGVALTLSALGIYGVTSYAFTLRRREMGIRLALGARRADVYALVLRQGFRLTIVGLAMGLAGALAVTYSMRALLFNTAPADPVAWLGMVAIVGVSTAVACLVPARRAAGADPTAALRAE